jgi:hypothetical protein
MLLRVCSLIFALLLAGTALRATAQNAQFSGIVKDQQGAVIQGAEVRVASQATAVERKTVTNADGIYVVPFLIPDVYQIFVQAHGFTTRDFGNLAWPTSAVCFGPPCGTLMLGVLGSAGA